MHAVHRLWERVSTCGESARGNRDHGGGIGVGTCRPFPPVVYPSAIHSPIPGREIWGFMARLHLHLLSDSTGETLEMIAKAALAQFDDADVVRHFWPMVRSQQHLDRIMGEIAANPGQIGRAHV